MLISLQRSDVIQTGHIWFFQLAVCFWVLGLPLFFVFFSFLQENEGFGVIMKNFNHERWGFVVQERRRERAQHL